MPYIAAAAAVIGAGAAVYSAVNSVSAAKRAAAQQKKAFAQQKIDAQIARQNAKARSDVKKTIGSDIAFGTGLSDDLLRRGSKNKKKTGTSSKSGVSVGGVKVAEVGGL